jgi:uncharacterized damage-inducible protein DinB
MSISAEMLRHQLNYHAWASGRLLESASELTPEEWNRDFRTSDRSVLGTLAHIFAADRIWLARVAKGPIPPFISDADYDPDVLRTQWPPVLKGWTNWGENLTDEAAAEPLSYTDLRGRNWAQPLWHLVLHVVNHGTHHRGQVSGFLRSLGHAPPPLDLHHFSRQW